jgi:predicted GIY-YIG superfamily endonuclease
VTRFAAHGPAACVPCVHAHRKLLRLHPGEPQPDPLHRCDARPDEARVQHKWRECGGFTARYNCDRLVWYEGFREVGEAILREKELKGWRREKKLTLIASTNPAWVDLPRDWYEAEPVDFARR